MGIVTTLITGFTPFAGRQLNSSWEAIAWINAETVMLEKLPVKWGEPTRRLSELIDRYRPNTVLSFGEGKEGLFQLETKALNRRDQRLDEFGRLPPVELNSLAGPSERHLGADVAALQEYLIRDGYPTIVSLDAGQYLCEETMYTLEGLRVLYEEVERVYFCHLPPHGTEIELGDTRTKIDARVLRDFASRLMDFLEIEYSETKR